MNYRDLLREQAYIDGTWCGADNGTTVPVTDPGTDEVLGTVPEMGASETRRAIEAAAQDMSDWAARTAGERSQIL